MNHFDVEGYIRYVLPYITNEKTVEEADLIRNLLCLPRDSQILDLCCGNGRHAVLLSAFGYKIKGLDASEELIKLAKEKAIEHNVGVEFVVSDMRSPRLADNEFDAVYNFYSSFGFFDDTENCNVLKEIGRVLKPGGKFLLETIDKKNLERDVVIHQSYEGEAGLKIKDNWEFDRETNFASATRQVSMNGTFCGRANLRIRLYSVAELTSMFSRASLNLTESYCWDENPIKRIIAVGQKVKGWHIN